MKRWIESKVSAIREFLFPIKSEELGLFFPLLGMFFLISFCYSFLRTSKDVLVISRGGAEILSALKLYLVLPGALLYTSYYSFLCDRLPRFYIYYFALMPFFVFYALFYLVLYPYELWMEPETIVNMLNTIGCPQSLVVALHPLCTVIAYWPFSLYYVMAELWGSAGMSLLFWGFTNSLVTFSQAKRLYALFGIGANLGLMATGPFIHHLAIWTQHNYHQMIEYLMLTFLISLIVLASLYSYVETRYRKYRPYAPEGLTHPQKLSWFEAIQLVLNSRHLLLIAVLVISYGLSINLVEIVWKSQVTKYFLHSSSDLNHGQAMMQQFSAHINTIMGSLSIFLSLFVSTQSEKFFGWTVAALMTPVILLVMGAVFFTTSYGVQYPDSVIGLSMGVHLLKDPLYICILVGALQNILSKAAKYSLFDPTKEKAYFPLTDDERTKGKGAVDVLGARFGKAMGAFVQQLIIILMGSLSAGFYLLGGVIILACIAWITAAVFLGRRIENYEERLKEI